MNIRRFMRIWLWIALVCCILSVMAAGLALYVEFSSQCTAKGLNTRHLHSDMHAAVLSSAFMVSFFIWNSREKSIALFSNELNSEYRHFHLIHERIPITGAHAIVYLPMVTFCALTLAAPMFSFVRLHSVALICKFV